MGLASVVGAQVALAPAQLVEAQVARDGVNPPAEVERVVDAVHHAERLHEGFLRDVLGEQRVPELAPDEPVDGRDVAAWQPLPPADAAAAIRPAHPSPSRPPSPPLPPP